MLLLVSEYYLDHKYSCRAFSFRDPDLATLGQMNREHVDSKFLVIRHLSVERQDYINNNENKTRDNYIHNLNPTPPGLLSMVNDPGRMMSANMVPFIYVMI